MIIEIFQYYNIPIEDKKHNDEMDLFNAQIIEENWFNLFPFEYELNRRFFLFANNNSLHELNKWFFFNKLEHVLKEKGVSFFGNALNWSNAWNYFSDNAKRIFVYFLIYEYSV